MNLIYTVLAAVPIGFLIRPRATALLTYLVLGSWIFAFQSVSLVLSWIGHAGRPAFGPFPTSFPAVADNGEVIGYAAVNLVITTIGVGLVVLGHRLRARRQSRSEVSLDTATV